MGIVPKKKILSKALYLSKGFELFRRRNPRSLVVFCYHRIKATGKHTPVFEGSVFGPTNEQLYKQLNWLKRHADILSEDDLINAADGRIKLPHRSAAITFDDGYRDNFTLALPVLKALNIPAIFFIPTDLVEHRQVGWWDLTHYLIKNSENDHLHIWNRKFQLPSEAKPAICFVQNILKTNPEHTTRELIAELAYKTNVKPPSAQLQNSEIMTWDEIKAATNLGIAIGSHTCSHRVLATLTPDAQAKEMITAKQILEHHLSQPIRSIAYPVGGQEHYTEKTKQIAADCGYNLGFSFETGANLATLDGMDIKRVAPANDLALLAGQVAIPEVFC